MKIKVSDFIERNNIPDHLWETYLVRGLVDGGRAALVRIPKSVPREEVESFARPLLVAEFAAGRCYQVGINEPLIDLVNNPRESIIVGDDE